MYTDGSSHLVLGLFKNKTGKQMVVQFIRPRLVEGHAKTGPVLLK
jgi:hypothetical protein